VADPDVDERGRGLDRVINFSDAVFAIAITLLVLNLRTPHLSGHDLDGRLLDALGHDTGLLVGFVISFFVIARFWITHHRLSLLLRKVDTTFMVLNLVFLAFIVFIPFPAEILGSYGSTTTAVVFYAGSMAATGVMSAATWEYALRRGLDDGRASVDTRQRVEWRSASMVVVFAASIPVAFIDPNAAKVMWVLLIAAQGRLALALRRSTGTAPRRTRR
jgi:uncharacterized membrane protein